MLGLFGQAFRPSGPRRAYCFGTGNQFRDKGTIRDREPFRDREPRSRRGFCFTIPGWEPLCSARGNQVCDDSVATIPDPSWRPRIDPPWRPRTERIGIAPRVGGKGNQFRVCVRAVSRRTVRPSFLGVHRSRPPCSRQMRRSARQPALSTSARRYPEHRSPIGTLPGGSGVQLVGDTRFRLCGKPETRHGGCRPKATVKQRPMELVWVCVPPEGGSGGRKRLSLSNVGIEPTTFRLWGLRSTTAPQLWCSKVTPKSRPIYLGGRFLVGHHNSGSVSGGVLGLGGWLGRLRRRLTKCLKNRLRRKILELARIGRAVSWRTLFRRLRRFLSSKTRLRRFFPKCSSCLQVVVGGPRTLGNPLKRSDSACMLVCKLVCEPVRFRGGVEMAAHWLWVSDERRPCVGCTRTQA
jgi:hypothetical protein